MNQELTDSARRILMFSTQDARMVDVIAGLLDALDAAEAGLVDMRTAYTEMVIAHGKMMRERDAAEARAERAEADADTLAWECETMIMLWKGAPEVVEQARGALKAHDEAVKQRP